MRRRLSTLLILILILTACTADAPAAVDGVTDADTPADIRAAVADLMPALERLSGLDRVEELRVRRQSREDARAYVERRLDEDMPADVRDGARRTYVALGLVPDTLDLDRLLLDLYTEQVLGYYDPGERTLFVIDDADAESLRPVLVHELVHALQDQHTDLDSIVGRERGNDRQTAAHAAMEGHAMLVMFAYLAEQATGDVVDPATLPSPATELGPALEAQNEQYPVFGRAPAVIRETLLFPYLYGADFVHRLWTSRAPLARYPAPIDSLLPQSTEQVMHPDDRFIGMPDAPVEVSISPAPSGRLIYENTMGQLETGIFLEHHLGAQARAFAQGWRGDRFMLVREDTGRDVLHWLTVWDTPEAADRFMQAIGQVAARRPGRTLAATRLEHAGSAAVRIVDSPRAVQ